MSFRKEIKFSLNKTKMHQFLEWIEYIVMKETLARYFDNKRFLMHHDPIEGIIPRKKSTKKLQ